MSWVGSQFVNHQILSLLQTDGLSVDSFCHQDNWLFVLSAWSFKEFDNPILTFCRWQYVLNALVARLNKA